MKNMKECFGTYVFENIECMCCECNTECQSKIRNEREDKLSSRFPKCKGCTDILYCKDHYKCDFEKYRCLKNIRDRFGYSYTKDTLYIFTYDCGYCRKEIISESEEEFYITDSFKDDDIFKRYFERV